jgi:hypothetical protein
MNIPRNRLVTKLPEEYSISDFVPEPAGVAG